MLEAYSTVAVAPRYALGSALRLYLTLAARDPRCMKEGVAPLVARLLLCGVFIPAAVSKAFNWDANASYMASRGMPLVPLMLGAALAIESVGTICLVIGWRARIAASVMAVYLVPVSLVFHTLLGTQFLKNAGIAGGLIMIAVYGPGRLSLDAWRYSTRTDAPVGSRR
jgi:putative oxidoreductase